MISAFSTKLSSIEGKLSDQQKQINDVRSKVVNSFLSDEEIESGKPDTKSLMLRFQGQLKSQIFQVNELKSRVAFQDSEIVTLKADVLNLKSNQSVNAVPSYNPLAPEFCPRQILNIGMPMSTQPQDINRSCQNEKKNHNGHDGVSFQQSQALQPQNNYNGGENNENGLAFFKARLHELEAELVNKNAIIHHMLQKHEELLQKERESVDKQDWYDHKMRLLKQDKRRRGETIGKCKGSTNLYYVCWGGGGSIEREHLGRGVCYRPIYIEHKLFVCLRNTHQSFGS